MERFKQVQHLKLTYTYLTEDELNIVNHLSSFSALTSLYISFNTDQRKERDFNTPEYNLGTTGWNTIEHNEIEEKYSEVGECRRLISGSDAMKIDLEDRFIQILFHQSCPLLQQLYVYGIKIRSKIMNITFGFYFPSLLYIHMNKINLFLAIQILDRCNRLRSFSSELYHNDEPISSEIATTFMQNGPGLNNKSLTAMTKLDLKLSDCMDVWRNKFLKCLLSCCANLCTFLIDVQYASYEIIFFDANWWTKVLASNKKLQRISLQLHYETRDCVTDYSKEVIRSFRSSNFFTQLKVNVTCDEDGDFPYLEYHFSIKN